MTEATARLEARFSTVRGATQLAHSYCSAPLKIAKTFPLDGAQIGVCVMDCSPGLLAGDHYQFDWRLDEGASVFLTNQSFTRVHPSRERPCSQRQRISVARGAVLEYFPEPVMLFRDAALCSESEVAIEPGGTLLMSDILCAGRIAREEAFQFHSWHSRLRVRYGDELIFCSQTRVCPHERDPRTRGAWARWTHWGNFTLFTDRLRPPFDGEIVQKLRAVTERHPAIWSGVSLTYRHGVIVSMLGERAWDLQEAVRQLREVVREALTPAYTAYCGVAAHNWLPG